MILSLRRRTTPSCLSVATLELWGAGGRTKVQLCVSTCADKNTPQVGITSRKPGGELGGIARCESPTYQVETKQPRNKMKPKSRAHSFAVMIAFAIGSLMSATSALGAVSLNGQVLSGGGPVASSTVTLWAATAGAPTQMGQAHTGADGRFTIAATGYPPGDATLYLVAKG